MHFTGGLRILIDSRVPEGKGVSSSAAVEVATMRAVAAALGIELPGEGWPDLCQLAENRIVGAPCGIMDQMTSALGRESALLALHCQPATIEDSYLIPAGIAFWGSTRAFGTRSEAPITLRFVAGRSWDIGSSPRLLVWKLNRQAMRWT